MKTPTRWLCLALDLLGETDQHWETWYIVTNGGRGILTKNDLRAAVLAYGEENDKERDSDPEWNIFDPETQRTCMAFLDSGEKWVVIQAALDEAQEIFEEDLYSLLSGESTLTPDKIFSAHIEKWRKAWAAKEHLKKEPGFLFPEDGSAVELVRPRGATYTSAEISALLGGGTYQIVEVPTKKMFYAKRRLVGPETNAAASRALSRELRGPILYAPLKHSP